MRLLPSIEYTIMLFKLYYTVDHTKIELNLFIMSNCYTGQETYICIKRKKKPSAPFNTVIENNWSSRPYIIKHLSKGSLALLYYYYYTRRQFL